MKKIVIILSCLVLIASVAMAGLSCGDNGKEKVTWKLATWSLPDTFQTKQLQSFADLVNEKSNGRMEVKVYTGGAPYQVTELYNAVQTGAVDLAYAALAYYFDKMPITASILSYSTFVGDDVSKNTALSRALVAEVPGIVAESAATNLSHLLWLPTGSSDLYTKTPVKTTADLKGMKIGAAPGIGAIVTQLGASPVEMDMSEIYLSAQTGLIDAWLLASTEDSYLKMRWYEVLPDITIIHLFPTVSVLMNQASFKALPEDLQKVVQDASSAIQAQAITAYQTNWQATLQSLENNASLKSVYVLPDAERATWFSTAFLPVMAGVMGYYAPASDIAKVQEILARDIK